MTDEAPLLLHEVADGVKRIKVRRGRSEYELNLDLVERLSGNGLKPEEIAAFFGMTLDELKRKRKVSELLDRAIETGRAKGVAQISSRLYRQAMENNVIAQIFYLKTVGKWREADKLPQEDDSRDRIRVTIPHNFRD